MSEKYFGDLNKTGILHELRKTPRSSRDDQWLNTFYDNVADASFVAGDPQLFKGPDGFPYMSLSLPEPGTKFQCFVIRNILDSLLENGVGVVLQPGDPEPLWVFSFGDLVGFKSKQNWMPVSNSLLTAGSEVLSQSEQVLLGQPSEELMPAQARAVLRKFLQTQGIAQPQILLMMRRVNSEPISELVFGIEPEDVGGTERLNLMLRWISWFLPRGVPFCSMKRDALGKGSFADL